MTVLAMVVVAGWVVAVAPVVWAYSDIARIPRPVWYWTGFRREPWRVGLAVAWLCGGWPAIAVVVAWRRSAARRALLEEKLEVRNRHHRNQPASQS
jgi:hypothetical protein